LLFLGHNFLTRNVRKSIKISSDSDSRLVSNENLNELLPSSSWALGQVTRAKMSENLPNLWRHSQKMKPKTQNYFCIADSKTCRVFWGFEQLSSTIEWRVMGFV